MEAVTVAELSSRAQVPRTSFYSHASSPTELLVNALVEEITPGVEQLQLRLADPDLDFSTYWEDFYRLVLQHVADRRRVYTQAVSTNSQVLVGLYEHYLAWIGTSLEKMSPVWAGGEQSDLWAEMARQQQAHSLVAVITAWVNRGLEAEISEVINDYWTLAPPWQLAKKDASGDVRMHRRGRVTPQDSQVSRE